MILKLTKVFHDFKGNVKEKPVYINSYQILCLDEARPEDDYNTIITMAIPNDNNFDKYFNVKENINDLNSKINNTSTI